MPAKLIVARPDDFVEFRKESILQGIHERFEEQVHLHPGNIALKTRETALTYAEINGFANSMAAEILSASDKEMAQAALLLPNAPQVIVAILAALKAHKAYVPLDPNFPKDRLRIMVEDAEPVVLITDDAHMGLAEELAGKRARIINSSRIKGDAAAPNPQVPCDPLDRAYILFTSGSTGRPKGIAFLHRNLLHHIMCMTNHLFFAASDQVTWLHSASFAASVVDIYCCLANGGTLYPWDVKRQGFTGLAQWLAQANVTTFQWIPSAFRQFLRTVPDDFIFPDIRMVVMASESLTVREVELFRRHFPVGSHLVNQVGTSESYNYRLYAVDHQIPIESVNVAAGYSPSVDRQVVILDDERRELPPGSVGEIGVRSNYMCAGYWRDEALTRARFLRIGESDAPVYLTGDLGRLEPDDCLIHLGRRDSQVKIHGYRVELAEIDHVLSTAPGVADSAAGVAKNRLGEDQLVGYLVLKDPAQFRQQEVERYLESRLPDYMVPRHYVSLDSLPTLPTGKVDRRGLPNPPALTDSVTRTPVPEAAPVEHEIVNLFRELLQLDDLDSQTHFLRAGGDSLLTALLMHRIHQRFNVEIEIDHFVECPTAAQLANLIKSALETSGDRSNRVMTGGLATPTTPIHRIKTPTAPPSPSGKQNLIIISAGKLGRETFSWAAQAIAAGSPWRIKGFLDDRADPFEKYDYDSKILGDVETYQIEENDVFIGAIGDPKDKVKYYTPIIERGGRFVNVIHPLANLGKNVQLGVGILLAPFALITCDAKVGDHVSMGAFSNAGHDTVIGDWSQIGSHCGINGNATLGEGVCLGSHACVLPNTAIGNWAFVGAGSIVVNSVAPGVKVFGNPAIPFGRVSQRDMVRSPRMLLTDAT
jgi:sugar O-acyltransferase (sialic acid O-acetyltransferase NeuD family)